jgi:Xaa-Pro aminopeptidase
MEMEEDYSQESSVSAQEQSSVSAEERIQRNRNVRYFSGCECRKCFEFTRRVRFRKRKAVIFLRNRHQRFLRKGVRLWEKEASSSSADVSSNVEQQETVEDYVESSRSQEQSQERSMEMEEDYSQESSVSAQEQSSVSAEEEYSATETSDTSQVASAESVFEFKVLRVRREFGFGNGKQ